MSTGKHNYLAAEERRRQFLQLLSDGLPAAEACTALGISANTYRAWRSKDHFFAAEADSRISGARRLKTSEPDDLTWEDFMDFRWQFFGHKTPPHQAMIIQAMEQTGPGDVTMILVPPEHGKTTIFEDWATYKLSLDPEWRCMVGCEAQQLAVRILARIKNRMDPEGPFPKLVRQFGPYAPVRMSGQVNNQTWTSTHFNVHKRQEFDERDYSMSALGFGSNIIGSRTDHLHNDDLQSKKTINKTESMVETFVQDWLTRPGETGVTTINGTRAGDGDFYESLMTMWEGESFFRVVRLPAVVTDHTTGTKRPLWEYDPTSKAKNKGYTMEMLEKIERKHGPDVWSRSYMQEPRSKGLGTFTEDIIDRCLDYQRKLWDDKLPAGEGSPVYIGLDPALGGVNCISAWQITPDCIYLVDMQEDQHLQRNEDIMDRLEMVILRLRARGARVTDVIVETMNFQRGLARDERFKDLGAKYGFAMREHLTNANKYNEDIGVASMPSSFIQRHVNLPYDADEHTRSVTDALRNQLLRWRPGIKGSILRQDQVMSLWFVWIVWQSRRRTHPAAGSTFKSQGLPWKPTNTGLLIPTSSSPFFGGTA